jgi:hypothetical protein
MAITSTAGAGVTITSAAVSDTLGTAGTSTTITFTDTFTNLNNGNTGTSSYAGRLAILRPGTSTEEVRYISSEITTTQVEVSEPFEIAPASSDVVDVSYIIEDAATVNGLSLVNKRTNDYSSNRRFTVGSAGFFALLDGASLETVGNGSTTQADIIVQGRFDNGYLNAGQSVAGGSIFGAGGAGTANADLVFDCNAGGEVYLYDMLMKGVNVYAQEYDGSGDFQRVKFFSSNHTLRLSGPNELRDCIIEGVGGQGSETVEVDDETIINALNLVATSGFITADNAVDETLTVRDCRFINNSKIVFVNDNKKWNFVNPTWTIDRSTQYEIQFENGTNNEVREQYSFKGTVTDSAAADVSGVMFHIYESGVNNIQHEGFTNVSGEFNTDIDKFIYTDNAGTSLTRDEKIGFTLKVYDYGFQPALLPLTVDQAIVQPLTLPVDGIVTEPTHQSGIKNGPANPIPSRHGTGELDPQPAKVFHYDGGTGGLPTAGEYIRNTALTASGILVEYLGDATEGTIVITGWNGTEFTNNEAIEGFSSSFAALADLTGGGSSFYQEYTWIMDCQDEALTVVYDNITAHLANLRHPYVYSFNNTGSVYTDFTAEAITPASGANGDVVALPNVPANANDATYFGALVPFNAISGVTQTTQGPTHTGIWEYWNGSSWATLTNDFQDFYRTNTVGEATWSIPSAWEANDDPGVGFDLFWARYRTTGEGFNITTAQRYHQVFVDKVYEELVKWGQGEYALPLSLGADGWRTFYNVKNGEGVWLANRGAGTIDTMVSDAGVGFTPPQSFTFTITGLVADTEVRIYNSLTREELAGTESSSTSFAYNYEYGGSDIPIFVNIHNLEYEWFRLGESETASSSLQLSNANQTIPVQQRFDRNFENP